MSVLCFEWFGVGAFWSAFSDVAGFFTLQTCKREATPQAFGIFGGHRWINNKASLSCQSLKQHGRNKRSFLQQHQTPLHNLAASSHNHLVAISIRTRYLLKTQDEAWRSLSLTFTAFLVNMSKWAILFLVVEEFTFHSKECHTLVSATKRLWEKVDICCVKSWPKLWHAHAGGPMPQNRPLHFVRLERRRCRRDAATSYKTSPLGGCGRFWTPSCRKATQLCSVPMVLVRNPNPHNFTFVSPNFKSALHARFGCVSTLASRPIQARFCSSWAKKERGWSMVKC